MGKLYLYPAGLDYVPHLQPISSVSAPLILNEDTEMLLNLTDNDSHIPTPILQIAQQGVFITLSVNHVIMLYMAGAFVVARLIKWEGILGEYVDVSQVSKLAPEAQEPIHQYLQEIQESIVQGVVPSIQGAEVNGFAVN